RHGAAHLRHAGHPQAHDSRCTVLGAGRAAAKGARPAAGCRPMRKITATAGSAVFLVSAPGVVAGLVPWWLTGWRTGAGYPAPAPITGAVLTAAGAAALLAAFAQFAIQGRGTP